MSDPAVEHAQAVLGLVFLGSLTIAGVVAIGCVVAAAIAGVVRVIRRGYVNWPSL